ncbi:hypothetical protein MCUN1_000034 [Malassezia cuniculi]|uniref:Uncharacterized protein n=1 Tax=Malassezia cuniculi TaxID=948313 RepID=A0AAF0EQZ2_9BASI|nr:hypothetical protein MCUN1_000034 [Malassezia cuniculi]
MSRNKAALLYDADAPYIVESEPGGADGDAGQDAPPMYTYTSGQAPTRSWDDASREKTRAINPQPAPPVDTYGDLESQSGFAAPPAPLNSTITGYATAYGIDLSLLCAFPYLLPPFTSIPVLIWETQNDLARFHAYQMAACGVCATIVLWFIRSLLGWTFLAWWLRVFFYVATWYGAHLAYKSALSLERIPFVPVIGEQAVSWVGEE